MTHTTIGLTINYRKHELTSRCISSLLEAGTQSVLVWDNSEDDGASLAHLQTQWRDDTRVHLVQSPCNLGFAAGVNHGVAAILARWPSAWVMLINNDATLRPNALQQLKHALMTKPQAVIAYPTISHAGREIGTAYYQRMFALLRMNRPWLGSFAYASGCALLAAPERRATALFDEDFFMYGEDWLLGHQLGETGMAYVPEVLVDHQGSASSGLGSRFYESRMVAAHWLLGEKLARNPLDKLALRVGRSLSLTARGLLRTVRYRSSIPLQALVEGWRLAFKHDPLREKARHAMPQQPTKNHASSDPT